jgi:hypothetical protein
VLDVGTQIFDDFFGGLTALKIGSAHIPKSGKIITGKTIQHIPQKFGAAEEAGGLNQDGDAFLFGDRKYLLNEGNAVFDGLYFVIGGFGFDTNIMNVQVGCNFDALFGFQNSIVGNRGIADIAKSIDAGQLQLFLVQFPHGSRSGIVVECAIVIGEQAIVDIVQFDSFEAEIDSDIAKFVKVVVVPPLGGKR